MQNCGNGVENRCGDGSRKYSGGDLVLPGLFLELSGLGKENGLKLAMGPGICLITRMEMSREEKEQAARSLGDAAVALDLPLKGAKKGLFLPAELLEDAGFFHVTGLDDLACTIEEGRILLEPPEEEMDEAGIWDALRDQLPDGICALLEDLGADPEEVWDILEEETV